ncbi:urease accessory protein UreF [Rhodobacter sp. SY28-1]|uniref:urease accessory protein UreF n=1 Tax=Rhodobacter sp. SY28-1 TaxID=2562317 RepID=UPI00148527F2|nr:urease accessory UreF family protein [Rhodobacter sp. SY28-1]
MTTGRMAFRWRIMAELDRLRLTQILSPAFPIGSFAHSQGLEWAIASGAVRDGAGMEAWVAAVISRGSGFADAVFLSMGRQAGADLDRLAELYDAFVPAVGRRLEAAELARGFRALTDASAPDLPYVLALARETASLDVPEVEVLGLYLQALAVQLLSVAVRFMPLGQGETQRILAALAPVIADAARRASGAGEEALFTFTPGADIAAMAQEHMETRIFRS